MFTDLYWYEEYVEKYSANSLFFAIVSLLISLLSMYLSAGVLGMCAEKQRNKKIKGSPQYYSQFQHNLQIISGIVFYCSMVPYLALEIEKLIFMHGKNYIEYYSSFSSQAPYLVHFFAGFMKYSLCLYLATFPSKKQCYIPLGLYFISAIPSLIIGIRNPIMLNAVFIFLYFYIRDVTKKEEREKWLGRFEKIVLAIGTPVVLLFMTMYSSIRVGKKVAMHSIGGSIIYFFYNQGVSFDVLNMGFSYIDKLPNRMGKNYTFGGIIDYFKHGTIAQHLFSAEALDSGNSIKNAMLSNSLSHGLAYATKGRAYIKGQGWGSSYLLETYIDFGYLGLIIYSVLIAVLLLKGISILRKSVLTRTMYLVILTQIYFVPRAEATGFLDFIVQLNFWILIIICYMGAGFCTKRYEFVQMKGGV